MILLINTSTPVCYLRLIDGDKQLEFEWEAHRELANNLLLWLEERLKEQGKSWQDIAGIGIFSGPGSFTGLRIGITVMNTLADSLQIPIVGSGGDEWVSEAKKRLENGENDRIVLPLYGSEANITIPRK